MFRSSFLSKLETGKECAGRPPRMLIRLYFRYPRPWPVIISLANILPISANSAACFAFIKSHAPSSLPAPTHASFISGTKF